MLNKFAILLCLLIALSGCSSDDPGSGGGIGGSGIRPVQATGATLGSISGFGSIVVNGVRFDTDSAAFFVNDIPNSQADLRVGMNVLAAVDFSSSEASRVDYVPSLIGPVESINLVDDTFESLGQTVKLGGGTLFENISLAEIAPGLVLEVSGLRDATGKIFATFVKPAMDSTRFQLVGTILSDLGDTQQFLLNGLQVNIAQADLSRISTDELEFGDKVYVTADSADYDSAQRLLSVDSVRVALEPMVMAGERVEYEGIVSSSYSLFEFDVYWQPIRATEQTQVEFQGGAPADLSMIILNTRVEIEGVVQEDGAYLASKIILIPSENAKLTGFIERIAPDRQSFTLLGLEVQVNDLTRFEGSDDDDGNDGQEISSFDELEPGDYVEVEASFLGNRLTADEVELDDSDERAILEGPVTAAEMNEDRIDIMNQSILVGPETSFENGDDEQISKQVFFELVRAGAIAKARWDDFQSVEVPPDQLELDR